MPVAHRSRAVTSRARLRAGLCPGWAERIVALWRSRRGRSRRCAPAGDSAPVSDAALRSGMAGSGATLRIERSWTTPPDGWPGLRPAATGAVPRPRRTLPALAPPPPAVSPCGAPGVLQLIRGRLGLEQSSGGQRKISLTTREVKDGASARGCRVAHEPPRMSVTGAVLHLTGRADLDRSRFIQAARRQRSTFP